MIEFAAVALVLAVVIAVRGPGTSYTGRPRAQLLSRRRIR